MKQVVTETVRYMWRSEKNRLFMVLSTALVVLYAFFVIPNISGEDEINLEMMEREMTGNVVQFEDALDDGLIVPNNLTGTTAYNSLRREYVKQRELMTALSHGDVHRFIDISYRPSNAMSKADDGISQIVFQLLGYELEQPFQRSKNKVYENEVENLTFHIIHDRTSLQQLHLFLIGFGPMLLFIGLIFLISDVHVKDRSLQTQKIGVPMSWQKYTFIQAITALAFVGMFYLALGIVFVLINGILHGFGTFDLPIGYYMPYFELGFLNQENYQAQTIGWFMLQVIPYLAVLGYLFTRLNTLFSLWTKQSVVTMVLGIFTLLFQFIYYGNDSEELLGMDISLFPQTYFDFGKILTGRFEQQLLVEYPNLFTRGLTVLVITALIIELLIFASTKAITRQKFVS